MFSLTPTVVREGSKRSTMKKKKKCHFKSGLLAGGVSCSDAASLSKADPLDVSSGCGGELQMHLEGC